MNIESEMGALRRTCDKFYLRCARSAFCSCREALYINLRSARILTTLRDLLSLPESTRYRVELKDMANNVASLREGRGYEPIDIGPRLRYATAA